MKNIIKTDNYLLIVSDEEIKEGDYHLATRIVKECGDKAIAFTDKEQMNAIKEIGGAKKIIAHLSLNNSPILEGVDLLPPLEDEIEKLAKEFATKPLNPANPIGSIIDLSLQHRFEVGYNKAKEKYKYTEEDMRKVCIMYAQWVTGGTPSLRIAQNPDERFEQIIQSLQQPKYPIGFECEMVTRVLDVYPQTINHIPKTTTNSQGQTVLVGNYIYE